MHVSKTPEAVMKQLFGTPTVAKVEDKLENGVFNAREGEIMRDWLKANKPKIKDSGSRTEFSTGAVRDAQEGKGRMDLLPFRAIMEVSKVFEEGAKKYDDHNWRKGIPLHRYADSAMRHFAKWMIGWRDEPHLAMAIWNLLCLLETNTMIEEGELPTELNTLPYNRLLKIKVEK